MADQLWFMTHIREEEDYTNVNKAHMQKILLRSSAKVSLETFGESIINLDFLKM